MRKLYGMRITSTMRMNSSVNGNPRFRVNLSDGYSYLTEVDGSVGYDIPNFTHSSYENRTFTVTLTNRGHITQMELEGEKFQKGEVVNGMTILESGPNGIFLTKWGDDDDPHYSVCELLNSGIVHLMDHPDGYIATRFYVQKGGTFA